MTSAAFSQCAIRSDNGQTVVALFIGQRAGLDRDFECVVDEWNAEHHAEVRALNSAFRHEGNCPAFGGGIGRHIDRERDRLGHTQQGQIAGDASRMCIDLLDLRRGEALMVGNRSTLSSTALLTKSLNVAEPTSREAASTVKVV